MDTHHQQNQNLTITAITDSMLYTPRVAMIQAYAPHCEKRLGRKGPVTSISGALGTFGWVQQI